MKTLRVIIIAETTYLAFLLIFFFLVASTVGGAEIHKNGFGGITPLNTTGLTIFNETAKRSFEYASDSLVLSAEFSILETNGDVRDFSLFNNDLTLQNAAPSPEPGFVSGTFRTSLETVNGGASGGQWATADDSDTLDMENTNVSLVWWGQIKDTAGFKYITGKGCSGSIPYNYGLYLDSDSEISAMVAQTAGCLSDGITTNLPSGGLSPNQTYGIGITFEDDPGGANVSFWLDGEWIYSEISTRRVGNTVNPYYVGRSQHTTTSFFCNCTHDEVLVFKERLDNNTMQLLTTQQHDIVIKSGPSVTPQGFGGLWFALPWLLVFGLISWIGYLIFIAWREAIK